MKNAGTNAQLARIEVAADRARAAREAWLSRLAGDAITRVERRHLRDQIAAAEAELIRASTSRATCPTARVIR